MNTHTSLDLAYQVRVDTLLMNHKAKTSHIGSCYSIVDLLAVLYHDILNVKPDQPEWAERDRFILSKGHATAALYATLVECGFFSRAWLDTYTDTGSRLLAHVSHHDVPGIEISSGSLGHGLPIGCGMALAAKHQNAPYRVFVQLSDGECDEGSVWEAALFAPHHGLDNLVVIVDYNKIQSLGDVKAVLDLDDLADKWRAFQWAVVEIDGHDHDVIRDALTTIPLQTGKPTAIIAHTIKGKGVSFMENTLAWHYKSPNDEQYQQALAELERMSS